MSSHEQDDAFPARPRAWALRDQPSCSIFLRHAVQCPGVLGVFLICGLVVGVAYRLLIDPVAERSPANYLRSGLHGVGIALGVWAVQTGFASGARSTLGAALKRLPVSGEVVVRSLVMTAVLVIVGVSL